MHFSWFYDELLYNMNHTNDSFIIPLDEIEVLTQKTDIELVDKAKKILQSLKQKVLGGAER